MWKLHDKLYKFYVCSLCNCGDRHMVYWLKENDVYNLVVGSKSVLGVRFLVWDKNIYVVKQRIILSVSDFEI